MSITTQENKAARIREWTLLAVIGVDQFEAIQCECQNCGRRVYAQVHFIEWSNGALECWGAGCFRKELGSVRDSGGKAEFPEIAGRRMTTGERAMLSSNRASLKAWFQMQREERVRSQREMEDERARARKAEQEAFVASLASIPSVPLVTRRESQPRSIDPPLSGIRAKARDIVIERWSRADLDHKLDGLVGMFNKEVQAEMERLLQSER